MLFAAEQHRKVLATVLNPYYGFSTR